MHEISVLAEIAEQKTGTWSTNEAHRVTSRLASSARISTSALAPARPAPTPHATCRPRPPGRSPPRPPLRPSPQPRARTSPPSFSTSTRRLAASPRSDFAHATTACRSHSPRHLARVPRRTSAPPARARDARPAPRQRPCHSFRLSWRLHRAWRSLLRTFCEAWAQPLRCARERAAVQV